MDMKRDTLLRWEKTNYRSFERGSANVSAQLNMFRNETPCDLSNHGISLG